MQSYATNTPLSEYSIATFDFSLLLCSGNPARYQSRGVVRMNRDDSQPFEDQRLGVPGTVTESEADQHLRGMVKNQLDTHVTLERYTLTSLLLITYLVYFLQCYGHM